jgi:hypothetical protein
MLVGNKKDLEDQRDVSYDEAQKFAQENGNPATYSHTPYSLLLLRVDVHGG